MRSAPSSRVARGLPNNKSVRDMVTAVHQTLDQNFVWV
jgi:hypothetical protein